jgi:hypothetical protein
MVRVQAQSTDRVLLEVRRLGRAKTGRLELLRADARRPAGRIGRNSSDANRVKRELAPRDQGDFPAVTRATDLRSECRPGIPRTEKGSGPKKRSDFPGCVLEVSLPD